MVRILIGGDICPTKNDNPFFIKGDAEKLFGDLTNEIKNSDFSIANLETPLIEKQTPIVKSGAVFGSDVNMLKGIKNAGINFLNLSNNHILDHGEEGLKSTINALKLNEIEFSGAGLNINQASQVFQKNINGIRISIFSYCENEFSTATINSSGANPIDLIDFTNKIKEVKQNSDFVLLLYHGGKENYNLPTPNQMRICRFFIEQGVDLVTCQHSHTAGMYEEYKKGLIFYGQGNYLFDPYPLKRDWLYEGILIDLIVSEKGKFEYKIIPYVHNSLRNNSIGIRKMDSFEAEVFLNKLSILNKDFQKNPELVVESWNKLAKKLENTYLSVLNGNGRILRKINEKTSFLNFIYRGDKRVVLKNIIACETHKELLETILKSRIND